MINGNDIENLWNIISDNQIECIMFDYFDTIVSRKDGDIDIKRKWSSLVSKSLLDRGIYIPCSKLFYYRKLSEDSIWGVTTFGNEPNYRCLIQLIYSYLKNNLLLDFEDFYDISLNSEIAAEITSQVTEQVIVDFIEELYNRGMKIVLVSDFYLPKAAFEEFLKQKNIYQFFHEILVSSELDLRKSNGTIYSYIQQRNDNIKKTLMIGDNVNSDYSQPIKHGIHAYHLKETEYAPNVLNRNAMISKMKSILGELNIPFSEYALILYLFIERLCIYVHRNHIKDLYFLSREGEYLKKLFDLYLSYYRLDDVHTHYLCVSRFALDKVKNDKEKNNNFRKYLNDLGIYESTSEIHLVDVGWKGTMQDFLHEILPDVKFNGFYIGTNERSLEDRLSKKFGLVFSFYPHKTYGYDIFNYNSFLQEELLTASHGTVVDYTSEGKPVFEVNKECERVYNLLAPCRKEMEHCFFMLYKLFNHSGFEMSDFMDVCAVEYLNMAMNNTKGYQEMRKKIKYKDDNVYLLSTVTVDKVSKLKKQIKWCLQQKSGIICYYSIFHMYAKQIHLSIFEPLFHFLAKRVQKYNTERLFRIENKNFYD